MSSGKLLLGVLVGIAAGAILGILFAPDKGSETRKKLSIKGEDYADALIEKLNDFVETITDKLKEVTYDVSDFAEKTISKATEAKKSAETATD
jgi:gas vesicle protein